MSHKEVNIIQQFIAYKYIKKIMYRVKTRNITANLCFNNCIHKSVVEVLTTVMLLLIRYRS